MKIWYINLSSNFRKTTIWLYLKNPGLKRTTKDYETAFRAMHTLKGVAVNLGFTALYNVSNALTEKLRSQEYDNLDGLITDVKKQYDIVIEAIAALG